MTTKWKDFTDEELNCRHCGKANPNPEWVELMDKVQELRNAVGFPLPVTSGYRCPDHPTEARKVKPGQHSVAAVDLGVDRQDAHAVLKLAMIKGFTGIGVNQKGKERFIHLDMRPEDERTVWSY